MQSVKPDTRTGTLTGDLVFAVQMCLALVLGITQFVNMLTSTEGVSASMFLFTAIFFGLLFWMAIISYRKIPGRIAAETIIVYVTSVLVYSVLLIETFVKAPSFWESGDWLTAGLVLVGIAVIGTIKTLGKWDFNEPYLKTGMAVAFKAIPQLLLAFKILQVGGEGVSGLWILSFHCFTISRLVPLLMLNRQARWDRSRKSMLLSEIANEGSWIAVTISWLFR